ncbi:helix-turn-helix domain-containing protein [Crossiella sp. CA198]|uniref:helix-turn-helix domain-containing protein n=1 Tax=Crossiella sp. CA198 TaxID=3455607 RepID=UPI003F8D888B
MLNELCTAADSARLGQFSNTWLAETIGVSQSFITQLRRGQRDPGLDTVKALATAFDVHPAHFVGGRRDRTPTSLPRRPFREKLNVLFALVHPAGKGELSHDAVVAKVRKRGEEPGGEGWTISPNTIADLRTGKNLNPRLRHMIMLAEAFGADPAYFFDEELAERMESQLRNLWLMKDLGVESLILRATGQPANIRDEVYLALAKALKPSAEAQQAARQAIDEPGAATDGGGVAEADRQPPG